MNNDCLCESLKINIENTHYTKKPFELCIANDKEGYALILFENHCNAIGCFNISYCPVCGKKL